MIDDVKHWRGGEVPLTVDGAVVVVKRPPVDFLLRHHFFEFTQIMDPGIDADEGEGLFFEIRYERPLVRPGGPSGQSELTPEVEQYDLAAIVGQFEFPTVLVLAFDVRGNPSDTQMTDCV